MFGAPRSSQTVTRYTGVDVQTSSQGACIPIVYGANRIGTNLIWFGDFKSRSASGGKGGKGGGGKGASSYDYSAAIILALCEGPIESVGTVWANSAITTLGSLGFGLFGGDLDQAPWGWLEGFDSSQALAYSQTAYIANSFYDFGGSPSVPQHNVEVFGFLSGSMPGTPDVNMADVIPDYITNPQYGLDPGATYIDALSLGQYKAYLTALGIFLSPALVSQEQATQAIQRWAQLTDSWIFWSGTSLMFAPLGAFTFTGNGVTYTPQVAPIYNLGIDDFIFDHKNEIPVTVTRIDPADGYNNVQLDIRDRSNQYNANPLRYDDQTSEDQYGVLQSQVVQADEICDAGVGSHVAFLIGVRSVYIRNKYEWKGGYSQILLLPGDVVTLTEPGIGLSLQPVRITDVAEDEAGVLKFTAEEFPAALGTPALYPPQANSATPPPNLRVEPPSINPPAIFEPSPVVTNGQPQVWIATSGGLNWGGCDVWISNDGTNYAQIGEITAGAIQGTLTATLAAHADPDTVDTLAIDLTESDSALGTGATTASADAFQTSSLIDGEIIAYGTVSATGAETYNLTYLRRGVYSTTPASHAIGAQFTRIDPSTCFVYDLPQQYVGVTLYFKFPSVNSFGNTPQSISDATQYTYTPSGVGFSIAAPTGIALAAARATQTDGTTVLTMTASWTASTGPSLGSYEVQFSQDGGSIWPIDRSVGASALSYALAPAVASTSYSARVRAVSQSGLAVSAWDTLGSAVNSGTLLTSVPSTPTGLTATAIPGGFTLGWTASTDPSILSYQIWIASGSSQPFTSAALTQTISAPATTATVTGLSGSAITVFLVAVNAAGSSSPAS